ncbi:MAG: hypothetical protein CMI67_13285 [Pelagibaca sp.]|nr:hypothetical protein [Pelagibaca sp.]
MLRAPESAKDRTVTHQLATGRTATLIKLAFAAAAKIAAAFAAFAVTALVTRNLSTDDAGLFLLGFTLLTVLSVFFRLGLDNVLLRLLSAAGADSFAQEKLNRGLLWVATITIPTACIGALFVEPIAIYIFNKPDFAPILFWMLLALPAMSLFFLLSFAFQAQHRVVLTTLFQNLGVSLLFICGFSYVWFSQPETIGAVTTAQIYAGATTIVFFAAMFMWFGQRHTELTFKGYKDSELTTASMNLWIASIMSLTVQWSGILIAGAMLTAEDVALLTAAQRTAMLTSFVLMVVNMVVAPRYARLWKEGNIDGIRNLAKWATRGMVAMVLPVVAIMLIWPSDVMKVFGEGYEQAAILLSVLVVGQFVNVASGTVGYLLHMTGHEREVKNSMIYSGLCTLVLTITLIHLYGVLGAAVAVSLGVVILNLTMLVFVKKRLSFYPVG